MILKIVTRAAHPSEMSWETTRSWHLVRPLVYYLIEDFVAPEMVRGIDILDFSAGLGDLSSYMSSAGARRVVSTTPGTDPPGRPELDWRTGIAAGRLATSLQPESFDMVVARMVLQFPTWEGDAADPDTLTDEFVTLLRPGGLLVVAFHEFIPFESLPPQNGPPDVEAMLEGADPPRAALVRYLGLPPREGPSGESGFGLKVPMVVTTLQSRGFDIEVADHPEPFTFPAHLETMTESQLVELGDQVMSLKRRYLGESGIDSYQRPRVLREMLGELSSLFEFVTWPIVRIVGRRR
jgi:Methyltransferase domain